jgi:hypothetical protein
MAPVIGHSSFVGADGAIKQNQRDLPFVHQPAGNSDGRDPDDIYDYSDGPDSDSRPLGYITTPEGYVRPEYQESQYPFGDSRCKFSISRIFHQLTTRNVLADVSPNIDEVSPDEDDARALAVLHGPETENVAAENTVNAEFEVTVIALIN